MSVRINENPHKIGGDWHTYTIDFVAVDSKKDGKQVEMQGHDNERNLELYSLMTLKDAKIIYEKLGNEIRALGEDTLPTELIKAI